MIELVLIALLQTAEPVTPPAPAPQEQAQSGGPAEAPAAEAPADPTEALEAAPEATTEQQPQMRRERRCREVEITGRRMPQRVCRNVWVPVEPEAPAPAPQPQ